MERKKVLRKKTSKKHIVVFQDFQKKVLKTLFVNDGEEAQAPDMEELIEKKAHSKVVFAGWDQDISCVHSNLVVCPLSKEIPDNYLIMYFHENGKILGSETVLYGEDAKADYHPEKAETEEYIYHFDGWGCNLHSISHDCMAKARFRAERKRFRVRFYNADNKLLKEELIFYGFSANPPKNIEKSDDQTYRYHFSGWDTDFSTVKAHLNIHPLFEKEFINYRVKFFEEHEFREEKDYHYNDEIIYPHFLKRGYEYIWNNPPEKVTDSVDLDGFWEYANPKGKYIEKNNCLYEILNPSVNHGEVKCIRYAGEDELIRIPSRVKLGDYFYDVVSVGSYAFTSCLNMKKLICPDTIKFLENRCFAKNKKLQEIILGKNIISFGNYLFMDCGHLSKLTMSSSKLKKINREAFEKMNRRIGLKVPDQLREKYKIMLESVMKNKNLYFQ